MKAPFKLKIKRSEHETKYEVFGKTEHEAIDKPPYAASFFFARGSMFGMLDDARLKRLIRNIITAPDKPPGYLYEIVEASVAHIMNTFERFGLESYSVNARLSDKHATWLLETSLYIVDDWDCGDDAASPCQLGLAFVATAKATCYYIDGQHEIMRRANMGNAEHGIADKAAAVRRITLAVLRRVYNACRPIRHI